MGSCISDILCANSDSPNQLKLMNNNSAGTVPYANPSNNYKLPVSTNAIQTVKKVKLLIQNSTSIDVSDQKELTQLFIKSKSRITRDNSTNNKKTLTNSLVFNTPAQITSSLPQLPNAILDRPVKSMTSNKFSSNPTLPKIHHEGSSSPSEATPKSSEHKPKSVYQPHRPRIRQLPSIVNSPKFIHRNTSSHQPLASWVTQYSKVLPGARISPSYSDIIRSSPINANTLATNTPKTGTGNKYLSGSRSQAPVSQTDAPMTLNNCRGHQNNQKADINNINPESQNNSEDASNKPRKHQMKSTSSFDFDIANLSKAVIS